MEAEEVQLMQHLLTLFLRMMQNLMKQQIREFWGLQLKAKREREGERERERERESILINNI